MQSALVLELLLLFGVNFSIFIDLGLILKLVPLSWFGAIKVKQEMMTDEEEKNSVTAILRKSHRQSVR